MAFLMSSMEVVEGGNGVGRVSSRVGLRGDLTVTLMGASLAGEEEDPEEVLVGVDMGFEEGWRGRVYYFSGLVWFVEGEKGRERETEEE